MISIGWQSAVRSPLVVQYHPIRGKKVCPFDKITRYCIMSPSRWGSGQSESPDIALDGAAILPNL